MRPRGCGKGIRLSEYNEKCKEDWERVPRYDFEEMKLVRSGWEEGQQLKKVPGYKLENFGEYGDLLVPGVKNGEKRPTAGSCPLSEQKGSGTTYAANRFPLRSTGKPGAVRSTGVLEK